MKSKNCLFGILFILCTTCFAFSETYTVNQMEGDQRILFTIEIPDSFKMVDLPLPASAFCLYDKKQLLLVGVEYIILNSSITLEEYANEFSRVFPNKMLLSEGIIVSDIETTDAMINHRPWKKMSYSLKKLTPFPPTEAEQTVYVTVCENVVFRISGSTKAFSNKQKKDLSKIVTSMTLVE